MYKKNKITAPQFFGLMFLCNIILGITYNLPMSNSDNIEGHVISAVIALLINFILIIPIYKLHKINSNLSIADNCIAEFPKLGFIFLAFYSLYYLFFTCYILSLFNVFILDVVNSNTPTFTLTICVVLASLYAANKGIEGLARACTIITFIVIVSVIFILLTLIPQIETLNYTPLMYDNINNIANGTIYILSLAAYIPLSMTIIPCVKGNIKKALITIPAITYMSFTAIVIVVVGALGDYLKSQNFPLYAATTVAEIGIFRRLDAVYLGVFTAGLFITISLFLFSLFHMTKKMFENKHQKIVVSMCSLFIIIISNILPNFKSLSSFFYNINFILCFTILASFIIPLIILIKHKTKIKGETFNEN